MLLKRWPALMRDFGLKPWEMDLLTVDELSELVQYQNAEWEAIRKRNAEIERRRR